MPLYEYKCHSCGKTFEVIQKFSDEPLKTHAECGGAAARVLSAPAFHLKGSGWYATDYAKSGGTVPAGKSGGSESKSDSVSSDKAESKGSGEAKSDSSSAGTSSSSGDSKPAATTESK